MRLRTRATAPNVLVRGRRWAHSRSFSNECRFFCSGYVSGSAQPWTITSAACTSVACPCRPRPSLRRATVTLQPGDELLDFALVVRQLRVGDDLDVGQARAVVQLQKAEPALRIAPRANPALQRDLAADRVDITCVD